MSEVFEVELSNEEKMKVFFDEEAQIEALYTDSFFYSAIGPEFCLVFDIFYAKSGTEANNKTDIERKISDNIIPQIQIVQSKYRISTT